MTDRLARTSIGFLVCCLLAGPAAGQERRTVTGSAAGARDSLPLSGVLVRVLEEGLSARTDEAGRFVFRNLPRVPLRVTFERLGLASDTIVLNPTRDDLRVFMGVVGVRLAPVTAEAVPAARQRFDEMAQTSTIDLEPAEITGTPAVLEADVTRAIQLLPGIVAKNDFTTGFNVRGGEADQNLIQLDGVTVFNPSHLGGVFSTFDAFAVDRVEFVTGGFPAGYGGRLSSVLDVGLRTGNPERHSLRGQLSLLSAKALADGPIGGGATYLVGVRRTYADGVVAAFSDETLPYYFADGVGKVTVPLDGGATVSLTGYLGRDVLDWPWVDAEPGRDAIDLEFDWGNRLAGMTYVQPLGDRVLTVHVGGTGFSTGLRLGTGIIDVQNKVRMFGGRWSLALSPNGTHDIRIGGGVEDYRMTYSIRSQSLGADFFAADYAPRIWSAFIDDQWHPVDWLLVRPGLRVESVDGPGFTAAAPRVGVKAFLRRDLALTGSAGRYYQAIHSLRDHDVPVAIFDFWIGADEFTPVARSDHLVVGFEKWFRSNISISVEGYRKTFHNLVTRNREQDLKVAGDEFIPTDGDASGVDILARKYSGRVRGWVSYGYVRATRRTDGAKFPPAHDRRHTLNVVLQTNGPLGSEMGVRWGYGSPLPYTGFVGQWRHREYNAAVHAFDDFDEEPIAQPQLNGERYPSYNRLDISFRWRTEALGGVLRPYFQVVNVYNRSNIFVYLFDFEGSPATRTGVSQLPVLPSFGLEFEF